MSKVWGWLPGGLLVCCLFTFAFFLLLSSAAHAQTNDAALDAAPTLSVPPSAVDSEIFSLVARLLAAQPKLAALLLLIGALRVPCKLLTAWLDRRGASGADAVAGKVVGSPIYRAFHFLVDAVTSVKLDVLFKPGVLKPTAPLLVGGLLLLGFTTGCQAVTQHGNIVSVTQSVVGLDFSQDPSSATPHMRLGFVRSQFHVVPTGTNVYAPAVISSMDLDTSLSHQTIVEDFATGGATRDLAQSPDSPAKTAARAKATKIKGASAGTNAPPLVNTVTHTNELYVELPASEAKK